VTLHRLTSAMCALILVAVFALPAEGDDRKLLGVWTAKAQRDGKPAADVLGHRITFTSNRFEIHSKDGKRLYPSVTFERSKP
jgi:hypothetical protein